MFFDVLLTITSSEFASKILDCVFKLSSIISFLFFACTLQFSEAFELILLPATTITSSIASNSRLDLRENYSLMVLPGYLGSKSVVDKWQN